MYLSNCQTTLKQLCLKPVHHRYSGSLFHRYGASKLKAASQTNKQSDKVVTHEGHSDGGYFCF